MIFRFPIFSLAGKLKGKRSGSHDATSSNGTTPNGPTASGALFSQIPKNVLKASPMGNGNTLTAALLSKQGAYKV